MGQLDSNVQSPTSKNAPLNMRTLSAASSSVSPARSSTTT
jgi:hypothetical protein